MINVILDMTLLGCFWTALVLLGGLGFERRGEVNGLFTPDGARSFAFAFFFFFQAFPCFQMMDQLAKNGGVLLDKVALISPLVLYWVQQQHLRRSHLASGPPWISMSPTSPATCR